jgi:hypothetical protein
MPARTLPEPPSLENLKKQAKDLTKAYRAGQPEAIARVAALRPNVAAAPESRRFALADAQLVVAREYGLKSWPRLVRHLALDANARRLHELDVFFQELPGVRSETLTLLELLEREVDALLAAHRARVAGVAALIRGARGQKGRPDESDAAIFDAELTRDQAREAIARWHWFGSWADAQRSAGAVVDPIFEAAADAIVAGEAEGLAALVARAPAIVRARSPFGHHATLLHHVTANGVEVSRQWQSPSNAVELARILLAAGADVDATCDAYGGGWTALTLLVTSGHPALAGVQADLVEVLCRSGASPDGLEDDGKPLWDAITSGYTPAVDRLVRCGARVDNLIFAASVGDLDAVSRYFDAEGKLDLARARDWGKAHLPGLGRDHVLEYALIHAAYHGRREVVELLLSKGPDLAVREPFWNNTALEAAEYSRHAAIAALIAAAAATRG